MSRLELNFTSLNKQRPFINSIRIHYLHLHGDFPSRRTFIAWKFSELFKAPKFGTKKFKSTNEKPAFFRTPKIWNQPIKIKNIWISGAKKSKNRKVMNNFDCYSILNFYSHYSNIIPINPKKYLNFWKFDIFQYIEY